MLSEAGIKDSLLYPPKHETLIEYILYHRRSLIKSTFSFLRRKAVARNTNYRSYPTPLSSLTRQNSGQVTGQ